VSCPDRDAETWQATPGLPSLVAGGSKTHLTHPTHWSLGGWRVCAVDMTWGWESEIDVRGLEAGDPHA